MNLFEVVKASINTQEAAQAYGVRFPMPLGGRVTRRLPIQARSPAKFRRNFGVCQVVVFILIVPA